MPTQHYFINIENNGPFFTIYVDFKFFLQTYQTLLHIELFIHSR